MWHRILNNEIVESVEEFGDEWMRLLTPGQLREQYGWVKGTESVKPTFDGDEERLQLVATFDRASGAVREEWAVVPVNPNLPGYKESESMALRRFAREHHDLATLMGMTPQEVADFIDTAFANLNATQRRTLRALAVAVRVLASRRKLL